MKLKSFNHVSFWVVCFMLFVLQSHAALPPEAQEALDKGVIAAKQQDYLLAVRFFQDARKIAPDAPEVFYNLGLAESKIPGRELRAMAWFGAYLAATTNAPNAAIIREQIQILDVKSQSNLSHLIQSAEENATENHLGSCADLWAMSGDFGRAKAAANLIQDGDSKLRDAQELAKAGDVIGAQEIVDSVRSEINKVIKLQALYAIAKTQIKSGDTNRALQTIAGARSLLNVITKEADTSAFNTYIGEGLLSDLIKLQADAGDISNANKSANLITDLNKRIHTLDDIAMAQVKSGDLAGARMTFETGNKLIENPSFRTPIGNKIWLAQNTIAEENAAPDVSVHEWIRDLEESNLSSSYCSLNHPMFLDLSSYLKTQSDSYKLRQTAYAIIEAQKFIERMLKKQAKQQSKQ